MRVSIVRSGMSFPEWEIETPALPRIGDHIQLWSHDDSSKTNNFEVLSVMFMGEKKLIDRLLEKASVGIVIHVKEV